MFRSTVMTSFGIASAFVLPMGCYDVVSDDNADNIPERHGAGDTDTDSDPLSCEFDVPSDFCEDNRSDGLIQLASAQNFYFEPRLHIAHTVVRGKSENLTVDWSGLTVDMYGRKMDPAKDVGSVSILLCHESQEKLVNMFNKQSFWVSSVSAWLWTLPLENQTGAALSDFTLDGECGPIEDIEEFMPVFNSDDPAYYPEQYTHMVTVQSGTLPGYDPRAIAFFTLDSNENSTTVTVSSDSTRIAYSCNVRNQDLIPVPHGDANITVNWEGLKQSVLGTELGYIYAVSVVNVSWDACELEKNILHLVDETAADGGWYRKELTEIFYESSLSDLVEITTGEPFNGIDDIGTWIIMLHDDDDGYGGKAPGFLGILRACE